MTNRILDKIRVLDFGRFVAAPSCAAVLADLGAEVIRIERREGGEDRWLGPVAAGGEGGMFLQKNRNKLSMTLEPRTADGASIARKLIATADVIITNLPGTTLTQLGLRYEDVKRIK